MSSLPFPVRVAAGLVVTAVEEVQALPRTIVGLPITAVSTVLQLSMRAQQVVTELAIKGDTALEGARPVQEAPSWATFDESPASGRAVDAPPETNGHSRPVDGYAVVDPAPKTTPDALPGYETLTIAQLRSRLRGLSLDQLTELLAWESNHLDRPPFVTMLSNRIATLAAEQ